MTTKRALIVDDSTTAQYRLKKMLRSYNLHIDVMDSGEAALRYLATNEPDVIFMDHLMPGMDGFRVLQIIKSHPETATIPVIMYTSKSGDVYTGQARALGALDVVSKDTINAADLSKVMQTIHLYPQLSNDAENDQKNESLDAVKKSTEIETGSTRKVTHISSATEKSNSVSQPFVERRASNKAQVEQSRNLELRLSHLEHTLEDSRRFITARVVKELQALKQNLQQEFTELHSQAPTPGAPAEPPAPRSRIWAGLSGFVMFFLLILIVVLLDRLRDSVIANQKQQQLMVEKMSAVTTLQQQISDQLMVPLESGASASGPSDNAVRSKNSPTIWDDLAWLFNQSSSAPFAQSSVDIKTLLRIHEVVNRATSKGFKGTLSITYSVGNFCIVNNAQGQAQLAPENSSVAMCMLSSELYGMDSLEKRYSTELESALNNLTKAQKQAINIVIAKGVPPEDYPDRAGNITAQEWNHIALINNRFDIKLDPAH